MYDHVIGLRKFIERSRIRLTAVGGDVKLADEEPSRFERRVAHVDASSRNEIPGVVTVRLEKPAPLNYRFWKSDRIYWCPRTGQWFGVTENFDIVLFKAELVGALYLNERARLEKFRFAIAGHDVRHILSHVLFRHRMHRGAPSAPLALAGETEQKGDALVEYAREMITRHPNWFQNKELDIIRQYIKAR